MALDTQFDELTRIGLFAALEPEALRELIFGAETRLLRAGDVLYRRGEAADGGYLLATGSIALEAQEPGAPAAKILRPLALLGETALVAATTRPVTALAREPSTVLKISRTLFHQILEKHPTTAARVRQLFKDRLKQFAQGLEIDAKP
jgi:CRP-like cAMP-binding protein